MGTRAQNLGSSLEETIWRSWKHGPPSAKAEHQNSFRRISDGIIAKTANWPGVRNTPLWTMYIGLLLKWQWSPRVTSNFSSLVRSTVGEIQFTMRVRKVNASGVRFWLAQLKWKKQPRSSLSTILVKPLFTREINLSQNGYAWELITSSIIIIYLPGRQGSTIMTKDSL